jgi:hypothetical protein
VTDFKKFDNGKPKLTFPLAMVATLSAVANVMEHGAEKYSRDNWMLAEGDDIDRYLDAAMRHLTSHISGDIIDADSGNPHLHNGITSLMMYCELLSKVSKEGV